MSYYSQSGYPGPAREGYPSHTHSTPGGYPNHTPHPTPGGYPNYTSHPTPGGYPNQTPHPTPGGYTHQTPGGSTNHAYSTGYPSQPTPGGYPTHSTQQLYRRPARVPPDGADPTLWRYFIVVDTDESNSIEAAELRQALRNGDWSPFDIDTVKLLMAAFDSSGTGHINFKSFVDLWDYISAWQAVFVRYDSNKNGYIEKHELTEALQPYGLPTEIINLVQQKYAPLPVSNHGPAPGIPFDRFLKACVTVDTLSKSFRRLQDNGDGRKIISSHEFFHIVLRAP